MISQLFYRILYAMLLLHCMCSSIFAQSNYNISGYVTEKESGECLIGAVIYSGNDWSVTNEYGFYSLRLPKGKHTLCCSYLGHHVDSVDVMVNCNLTYNIVMTSIASLEGAMVSANSDVLLPLSYVGVMNMPVSYIKDIPSILGEPDLMKSLQKLPGVQAGMAGFSGIYVRGGGAEENLVLMDGAPLYNASHLMGLLSTFSPESIKQVSLYKGFFPARFGGRTSSVLDVRTNDGNANKLKGLFSVGLINCRFHLEGPVKSGNTTFSMSLRGSNSLAIVPILKLAKSPYSYLFYDVTGKITHRFNNSDRLIFSVYHGGDYFSYSESSISQFSYHGAAGHEKRGDKCVSEEYNLHWGNNVASIRWNHRFGSALFSDLSVSWSDYRMNEETESVENRIEEVETKIAQSYLNHSAISDLSTMWDFGLIISSAHMLSFGLTNTVHFFAPEKRFAQEVTENGTTASKLVPYSGENSITHCGTESSLYFEDKISSKHVNASLGLRSTLYYVSGKYYPSFEPRVSAEYVVSDYFSARGAYARMSQYVHMLASGTMSLPTDLWVPITNEIKPIVSDHFSVGIYYKPYRGWDASLECYYKEEQNVLEYKDGYHIYTTTSDWDKSVEMGKGTSKGIELCIRKAEGKWTGMMAYTLSKTDRVFPAGTINSGKPFPFTYDRRHVFDCFVRWQITDKIGMNAAWSYSSGSMITASWRSSLIKDPNGILSVEPYIAGRNNYRLPSSHRLDVSAVFKTKNKHGEHIWEIGVYNIYAAQNPDWVVIQSKLNEDGTLSQNLMKRSFLVFLPSFSYTYVF